MSENGELRIDGPPPKPRPYGIVTTPGTIVDQLDPHWTAGVVVDSYPTDQGQAIAICAPGTMAVKSPGTRPNWPVYSSFTVVYPITCDGRGIGNEQGAQRLRDRAEVAFIAAEGRVVERELAMGLDANPNQPTFTDANLTVLGGGAVGPVQGLALLENALTGRQGMIHVDPATFTGMEAHQLIETDGARAYTKRGTPVIIGDGYIGVTHGAPLSGGDQGWAFATGPVQLTRDAVQVIGLTSQSLDRDNNSITFYAERNYIAYRDTLPQAGVLVDRSVTP